MLIQRSIPPDEWKPIGINELEANADEVVRSVNNRSVIAGPGSGKTELLAQRASFLLRCGVCKPPRRILAISFKRDAASNLAKRVRSRCHETQAYRFDSLTFDSFSKGLVDRFGQALPALWRPTPDYEIVFPGDRDYRSFLQGLTPPPAVGSKADIMAITVKEFERRWLSGSPLDGTLTTNPTPEEWAAEQFWQQSLTGNARSFLSFQMIARLAGLLKRHHRKPIDFSITSSVHCFLHFGFEGLLQKRSRAVAQDLGQRVRKKFLVRRVGKR
jgi:hypothetical protein